jgi:hypothetical protein
MTIIIPIGVDCGMADFLKENKLRICSFPFDWVVSYNGVSKCIEDKFSLFTQPLNNRINEYDIYFHHDFENINSFTSDEEKYIRRCKRLTNILETSTEEIIFCRKGHACHHHSEHNGKYCVITSDIEDVEKLNLVIANNYPNLKYKIIVILACGKCFNPSETYKTSSDKIEIYNISGDNTVFANLCRNIFKM